MHGSAWAALLKHIPADQHGSLMLVTRSGTEIAIQGLLRIDHEFVALKGRLAGSQEAGRVFFVPYAQIDYFGYQKPLMDAEFEETFNTLRMPLPVAASPLAAAPALAYEAVTPPEESAPAPAERSSPALTDTVLEEEHGEGKPRTHTTIRSEVLERYRARSQGANGATRDAPPASP